MLEIQNALLSMIIYTKAPIAYIQIFTIIQNSALSMYDVFYEIGTYRNETFA